MQSCAVNAARRTLPLPFTLFAGAAAGSGVCGVCRPVECQPAAQQRGLLPADEGARFLVCCLCSGLGPGASAEAALGTRAKGHCTAHFPVGSSKGYAQRFLLLAAALPGVVALLAPRFPPAR